MSSTTVQSLLSEQGYSVGNAFQYHWGSVTDQLDVERVSILDQHLVGKKILDAGCGGGGYVHYLTGKGYEAVGVDKFEMFLDLAKQKNLRGTFIQGDLTNLPFEDKSFDTTVCFDVLEHIDDVGAIQELARVTRNRILVTVPQEDTLMPNYRLVFSQYRDVTHLRYYTEKSLWTLAETVHPKKITIWGEGRIPIRRLVEDFLEVRSRFPFLSKIYKSMAKFLVRRIYERPIFTNHVLCVDL